MADDRGIRCTDCGEPLIERCIDKDNNHYKEIVVDPETGEIIHQCEEPLSEHRGHGSDKKKG